MKSQAKLLRKARLPEGKGNSDFSFAPGAASSFLISLIEKEGLPFQDMKIKRLRVKMGLMPVYPALERHLFDGNFQRLNEAPSNRGEF